MHCVPSSFRFMAASARAGNLERRHRDLSCSHYKHNLRTEFTVTVSRAFCRRSTLKPTGPRSRTRGRMQKSLRSRSIDRHSSPAALFPRLRSCLMSHFLAPSPSIRPRVSISMLDVFFRSDLIIQRGFPSTTIHFRSLPLFDPMSLRSPSLLD